MNWEKIETVCKEQLPNCVKNILSWCGYGTMISLQTISSESILQIEKHVNVHCLEMIQQLDCCHSEFYKQKIIFELLPGHRDLIIALSKIMSDHLIQNSQFVKILSEDIKKQCDLSTIMKELIQVALANNKISKNHAEYSDIIRYFATYIFLLCGRSCYNVLCQNLPFPSISTVCK